MKKTYATPTVVTIGDIVRNTMAPGVPGPEAGPITELFTGSVGFHL